MSRWWGVFEKSGLGRVQVVWTELKPGGHFEDESIYFVDEIPIGIHQFDSKLVDLGGGSFEIQEDAVLKSAREAEMTSDNDREVKRANAKVFVQAIDKGNIDVAPPKLRDLLKHIIELIED